jgi:hypothetical protein
VSGRAENKACFCPCSFVCLFAWLVGFQEETGVPWIHWHESPEVSSAVNKQTNRQTNNVVGGEPNSSKLVVMFGTNKQTNGSLTQARVVSGAHICDITCDHMPTGTIGLAPGVSPGPAGRPLLGVSPGPPGRPCRRPPLRIGRPNVGVAHDCGFGYYYSGDPPLQLGLGDLIKR